MIYYTIFHIGVGYLLYHFSLRKAIKSKDRVKLNSEDRLFYIQIALLIIFGWPLFIGAAALGYLMNKVL